MIKLTVAGMVKTLILLGIIALSIFILSLFLGPLLNSENERVINQLYPRSATGIIQGAEEKVYKNGHKQAIVLISGHMETPDTYAEIIEMGEKLDKFDIYAPLTPFHGRTLDIAANLNNQVVYDYFKNYIKQLSHKYVSLTVVGFSYGGLQLANLLKNNDIPKNVKPILYSPAIHIKSNTPKDYALAWMYANFLGRKYCNYSALKCGYPVFESVDEEGKHMILKEISLRYRILPAILEMYDLDNKSRNILAEIQQPFTVLIAKNDNRVNYQELYQSCKENAKNACSFQSFPSGKHVIHYGKLKNKFFKFVAKKTVV